MKEEVEVLDEYLGLRRVASALESVQFAGPIRTQMDAIKFAISRFPGREGKEHGISDATDALSRASPSS